MPKVVLIHGLFSNSSRWDRTKADFEARGYEVVTIDYRTDKPWKMNQNIDMQLARHQDADLFVGHSYGGMYLAQSDIEDEKIVTLQSPGAQRGYNINTLTDPVNALDAQISYGHAERVVPGGHRTHIPVDMIINRGRNKRTTGRSLWTQSNRWTSKAYNHFNKPKQYNKYDPNSRDRYARYRGQTTYFGE